MINDWMRRPPSHAEPTDEEVIEYDNEAQPDDQLLLGVLISGLVMVLTFAGGMLALTVWG